MSNKTEFNKMFRTSMIKAIPYALIATGVLILLSIMLNTIANKFPDFAMVLTGIVALILFFVAMTIRPGEEDFKSTLVLVILYTIGIGVLNLFNFNMSKYMIDFSNYSGFWLVLPWVFAISALYLADAFTLKLFERLNVKLQ